MTIIESIRAYLHTCPYMRSIWPNVNFLDKLTTSYSVETVPAEQVVRQYADGGALRQHVFMLASRRPYSRSVADNLANSAFSEQFTTWLEGQNKARKLPAVDCGEVQSIEALDSGFYQVDEDEKTARYQITCRLLYTTEG